MLYQLSYASPEAATSLMRCPADQHLSRDTHANPPSPPGKPSGGETDVRAHSYMRPYDGTESKVSIGSLLEQTSRQLLAATVGCPGCNRDSGSRQIHLGSKQQPAPRASLSHPPPERRLFLKRKFT